MFYKRFPRPFFALSAVLLTLSAGNIAHAERIPTQIAGFELGDPAAKRADHLVFLDGGEVVRLRESQGELFRQLREAQLSQDELLLEVDDDHYVTAVLRASPSEMPAARSPEAPGEAKTAYDPTVLPDSAAANPIFRSFNPDARSKSQCYNRAHVWAYESKREFNLDSMKVFMFFTSKYIRDYNYYWWFHVAPGTLVQTPEGPSERVLDPAFMKAPVPTQTWTNYFVKPKPVCPVVTRYQDYSEHQYEQYCYLIKVPMYYWQPRDIESVSNGKPEKTQFIPDEVDWAYHQGFGQ